MKYKCLSIAGFDGSGGAGIQADLKTFSALGCYGMTVLTALPVQNTCGVKSCYDVPLSCIEEQLETLFEDIMPDSIKIGMLFSSEIINLVSKMLDKYAKHIPIILDPVMVAKSGDRLLLPDAIEGLKTKLIPMASLITPNLPEAYALVGKSDDFEAIAQQLLKLGPKAVLLKGGHNTHNQAETSDDLFLDQVGASQLFHSKRIESKNTHGTGCTLSAAICAFVAQGMPLIKACAYAKRYLSQALLAAQTQSVGKGHGPVHHFYHLWPVNHEVIGV